MQIAVFKSSLIPQKNFEPCHEKTNILHMRKQRRVGQGRKPERWFSHGAAHFQMFLAVNLCHV